MKTTELHIKTKDSLWKTVQFLDIFTIETHRILHIMDEFSKLDNVQQSLEYKTIQDMLVTGFEALCYFGYKHNLIHADFKKELSMEQMFNHKRNLKHIRFIELNKLATFLNNNPEEAQTLFYDLQAISEKIGSFSETMKTLEIDIHSHLDYNNFNDFHKACSYTRSVHDLIKYPPIY